MLASSAKTLPWSLSPKTNPPAVDNSQMVPPFTFGQSSVSSTLSSVPGIGRPVVEPLGPRLPGVGFARDKLTGGPVQHIVEGAALTLTGPPANSNPATQPRLQIVFGNSYPVDVTVVLTLVFQPDSGADDPAVQFSSGGRTARITVLAGSTTGQTDVGVQTGTVAGTISSPRKLLAPPLIRMVWRGARGGRGDGVMSCCHAQQHRFHAGHRGLRQFPRPDPGVLPIHRGHRGQLAD